MFKHYIKIALRNLRSQSFYSSINVIGLAVGLAGCIMILLYIGHEFRYDQYHTDSDRIYRVIIEENVRGVTEKNAVTTTPLAETLEREFPEIELAGRIAPEIYAAGTNLVRIEGEDLNRYEEGFIYADPSFAEIFQFPTVRGDLPSALSEPNSIILTASKADQLFKNREALGQPLILNNDIETPYTVTAVIEDLPSNTHLRFDYLISMEGLGESKIPNWGFGNYVTYVKLKKEAKPRALETKLPAIIAKYKGLDATEADRQAGITSRHMLQPIEGVHLYSSDIQGYWTHGDIQYVWLFGAIAGFILIIASINFMNLSTARSANRSKEIGLRKVFGSFRKQLITQFLIESILVSCFALVIALVLVWQLTPFFNELTGQVIEIPWQNPELYLFLAGTALLVGLLAGAYPSVFLSSFRPIFVLKGKLSMGSKSASIRSILVVFQFATSILLIICSIVVWRQMDYIQNKKLGFEKNQILIIEDSYTLGGQTEAFKEELKALPIIEDVSMSDFLPVDGYRGNWSGAWPTAKDPDLFGVNIAKWYVDYDYINTLGIEVIEGRSFSTAFSTDENAILLNRKAAELLEFEDPIGKQVSSFTYLDPETGELLYDTYTVIGIVDDFHYESLKREVGGLSLVLGNSTGSTLAKISTGNMEQAIKSTSEVWSSFVPNQPFRYSFMDDRFAQMYTFEQRAGNVFTVFTILAIFIACLGLFALAAYMAEQRLQEVSIRKVLGASVKDVTILLTKSFVKLILFSVFVAAPLGWTLMNDWLQSFVYRTTITWDVFVIAGWMALAIAILTISYQAIKVAFVNPAATLRSE